MTRDHRQVGNAAAASLCLIQGPKPLESDV